MTTSGIEKATFGFVAQYLNHCATISGPISPSMLCKIIRLKIYIFINLPVFLYGCETWSLISRKENCIMGFENKVLRNEHGPERGDVVENGGKCIVRKMYNQEYL
jgi:hypothetical protein